MLLILKLWSKCSLGKTWVWWNVIWVKYSTGWNMNWVKRHIGWNVIGWDLGVKHYWVKPNWAKSDWANTLYRLPKISSKQSVRDLQLYILKLVLLYRLMEISSNQISLGTTHQLQRYTRVNRPVSSTTAWPNYQIQLKFGQLNYQPDKLLQMVLWIEPLETENN